MARIHIPNSLKYYTGGKQEITVPGATAGEAFDNLLQQFPELRKQIITSKGHLRSFINLYLEQTNIQDLRGLATPIKEGDQLNLIASMTGG